MKRTTSEARATDDMACRTATGRTKVQWFEAIDASGADGRAGIGKFLQGEKVDPWWIGTLTVEFEAARGIVEKDGRPRGYSICSTKTVDATAPRVFRALTTSADLAAWFGGGATIAAKEGGAIADRDGRLGQVTRVRPDKALAFTWDAAGFGEGSRVEVLVQPKGTKTGLVVNHTRIAARHDADELRGMWEGALQRLKAHLESR
jgi:uncharacterized protein YndB with AHSA1/START domain